MLDSILATMQTTAEAPTGAPELPSSSGIMNYGNGISILPLSAKSESQPAVETTVNPPSSAEKPEETLSSTIAGSVSHGTQSGSDPSASGEVAAAAPASSAENSISNEEKSVVADLLKLGPIIAKGAGKDESGRDEAAFAIAALAATISAKPVSAASSTSSNESVSSGSSQAKVGAAASPPVIVGDHASKLAASVPQKPLQSRTSPIPESAHIQVKQEPKSSLASGPIHATSQRVSTSPIMAPQAVHPSMADPSNMAPAHMQQQMSQQEAMAYFAQQQQQQQQQQQVPMDAATYFAAAQFQQQQQQHQMHDIPNGMLNSVWSPEEILLISQAQEQVNATAMQRAQAAYQFRITSGGSDLQAKEDARIAFQELTQQGQQMLQIQVQSLYQRKIQTLLQQRAMENARMTNDIRGRQLGAAAIPNMTPAAPVPTMQAASAGAPPAPKVSPTARDNVQAFSFLCQAVDGGEGSNNAKEVVKVAEPTGAAKQKPRTMTPPKEEMSHVEKWRESMIGKEIEVEYDGEWYPARVVTVDTKGIFVAIYEEDQTQERMKLFENFTAQDPDGDDEFKWRMRVSKRKSVGATSSATPPVSKTPSANGKAKPASSRKSATASAAAAAVEEDEDVPMESAVDEDDAKKDELIREGRERRAELRAISNAKRLQEEALVNARKADEEAAATRLKLEEEMKAHKAKLESGRKQLDELRAKIEADRKAVEAEKAQLQEERKANEQILQEIKKERAALAKTSASGGEEPKDTKAANKRQKEVVESEEESEAKESSSTTPASRRKSSASVPTGRRGGRKKVEESEEVVEVEAEEEPEPIANGSAKGRGTKRRSFTPPSSLDKKKKAAVEETKHDKVDEEEVEDEDEEEEGEEEEDGDEDEGSSRNGRKSQADVMRWSTRKIAPVKRFQAGLKGGWSSGRAPKALGYIPKGEFGFVPPTGKDALFWRVRVYWKDDEKFYSGTVHMFRAKDGKHKIVYDDGDVEWLMLDKETIEWFVPDGVEFRPLNIDPTLAYGL